MVVSLCCFCIEKILGIFRVGMKLWIFLFFMDWVFILRIWVVEVFMLRMFLFGCMVVRLLICWFIKCLNSRGEGREG